MLKKKLLLYFIIFAVGFGIAYFVVPSKTITKTEVVESEKDKKTITELQGKINILETTNINLKRQVKTLITQKPDGTTITEITETEESSEEKTRKIIEDYESKISELQQEITKIKNKTVEEINKKYLSVEVGYDTTRSMYIHGSYDLFSHFFVGTHGQIGNNKSIGAGLGIKL